MRSIFLTLFCTVLLLTAMKAQEISDPHNYCPNDADCPYGLVTPEPIVDQICFYIMVLTLGVGRSACLPFFGDSLDFSDASVLYYGQATTDNNVCDYYTSETVVEDCLYPNGTKEINFCSPLFALAYQLRSNCSQLYTIDTCNIPELGQLAINRFIDPENNCAPGPYIADCLGTPNPQPPEKCPNCIVGPCPSSS